MSLRANLPRPLVFEARTSGGRGELRVKGELDLASAERFGEALDAAAQQGKGVIVDLAGCDFIDSTGLALILRARRRLEGEGRSFTVALKGCAPQVQRLFDIGGLKGTSLIEER